MQAGHAFFDFIIAVIILNIFVGELTNSALQEVGNFTSGTRFYLVMSVAVCCVAYVDYRMEEWPKSEEILNMLRRKLSKLNRNQDVTKEQETIEKPSSKA